jgi:hypothetical protein
VEHGGRGCMRLGRGKVLPGYLRAVERRPMSSAGGRASRGGGREERAGVPGSGLLRACLCHYSD